MSFEPRLLFSPGNPRLIKRWLIAAGVNTMGTTVMSIPDITASVKTLVPEADEHFLHMAVAVAILTALPLIAFKKVLSISIAQFGVATSIIFIGYALRPVFSSQNSMDFFLMIVVVIFAIFLMFLTVIAHFYRERSWGDLSIGVVIYALVVSTWISPLVPSIKVILHNITSRS